MGLRETNKILSSMVDMLKEGKRVEIDWPVVDDEVKNLPLRDRVNHPKIVSYHKGLEAVKWVDVPRAVKQVMTWKRDMKTVDSYHTVIRLLGRAGIKRDFVFSAYDLDPDGPKRPNKYRTSVYMRRIPDRTIIIGEYRSLRAAKDAARKWLIDQASKSQARSLERISFNYKKLGEDRGYGMTC
jgi:hypothetical protein